MNNTFLRRRENLRPMMKKKQLAALLISYPANRFYFSGFELHDTQCNESSGCIILFPNGKDILCTDSRYEEAAKHCWDENNIIIYPGSLPVFLNNFLKDQCGTKTIGFEAKHLSWDFVHTLGQGLSLCAADGFAEKLRSVKDAEEIECIAQSVKLNHEMLQWLPSILQTGKTELNISWEIEKFYREHGASELSFSSIAAVNANAALPHYIPSEVPITDNCLILIDEGARFQNYCSDQTRTYWVGENPSVQFTERLHIVQEAQYAVIEKLRPGLTGAEAHQIAVDCFKKYDLEKYFIHSLGHGVGLETHEYPRLSSRNPDPLCVGNIVTIEPGLYFPGWGGIRWEHMALITDSGCRIL